MPETTPSFATPSDVEWIDTYGHAQVCGHRFTKADVLAAEQLHDRRSDGALTVAAKERIAVVLTGDIQAREARALANWQARHPGSIATYRDCGG